MSLHTVILHSKITPEYPQITPECTQITPECTQITPEVLKIMYLGHIFLHGGRQTIFLHCPLPKSGPTSPSKYLSTSTRNRMGNLTNQRGLAMLSQKDREVKTRDNNRALQKKVFLEKQHHVQYWQ